jgi:hypothetical protein
MRKWRVALSGLVVLAGVATVAAQDISKEQNKLLAKRAAEADAYRKLAEIVYGLQLNERTTVRDFVTESDDIRGEVDSFIKGIRIGTPTYYDDGSCEVPAEVTVAKVVETLRSAHDRYYKGDHIKTSDFESVTKRIEKNVIKVVGRGAPRPDLPPDLPQGAMEVLGPPPVPAARPPIPLIWQRLGPQARMMALRAAELDAKRKLGERIKGLRLTARTQVRDFITESDEIRAEMNTLLVGAETISEYLHSNELIAEVTLRLPTEQVITTVKELHSRHYNGDPDDTRGHDIQDIVKTVVKKDFEATGMGVPPPQYLKRFNEVAAVPAPDWVASNFEARGQGTDPAIETPQGRLKALRAAELDAKRKLAEQIGGLTLQNATTIRDMATKSDEIGARLDAFINGVTVSKTEVEGGTATVTVVVPGMEVWGVVNGGLPRPGEASPPPAEPQPQGEPKP